MACVQTDVQPSDGDVYVVRVELWRHGLGSRAEEITRVVMVDDGTGNVQKGFFDVAVSLDRGVSLIRKGRVENYNRKRGPLALLLKALHAVGYYA